MKYLSPSKVTRTYMNTKVVDAMRTPIIPNARLGTQYYGFEVEIEGQGCEGRAQNLNTDLWLLTRDGSLRNSSVEPVFARPLSREDATRAFDDFKTQFDGFDSSGMSDRTSVHVHYDTSTKTMSDVQKMAVGFYLFENLLFRQAGGQAREGNRFCLRNCDSSTALKALISGYQKGDVRSVLSRERSHRAARYTNLNLQALLKFGSFEVRCHKGTLDTEEFNKWLDVVDEVFTVSRTFRDPREIIEKQSELGALNFMEEYYPLINTYTNTIDDRQTFIYDGVDHAQMLAYCVEVVAAKPKQIKKKKNPVPRSTANIGELPLQNNLTRAATTYRIDSLDWF